MLCVKGLFIRQCMFYHAPAENRRWMAAAHLENDVVLFCEGIILNDVISRVFA